MNSNDYQILAKNNSAQKHRYGLIVKILGVALVYFIAARLGLLLELGNTNACPINKKRASATVLKPFISFVWELQGSNL